MNNIDERVVEMRFDNKQFESGISTSINSIDKLKKSLNFNSTSKELSKFEKASNSMRFNGLKNSFNTAVNDMSVWAIAKFQLVSRAVDKVTGSIERCVKSLSVDQVAKGWSKFEEKTTSVATLISQGYDMTTVEEQLRKLNWFTDETSYNFTDMAKNIGQFTAAGRDLPESVTALMGIANWAALSGQNAQTASRAMYQISQAMQSGVMRKEDYRSIQLASMATEEFQKKAIEAGLAVGTLKEVSDGLYQSTLANTEAFRAEQFSSHLTEDAWLTSDVMMRVFNEYSSAVDDIFEYTEETGESAAQAIEDLGNKVDAFGVKAFRAAQEARSWTDVIDATKDAVSTGWMNIFETVIGNYEEQKKLWSGLVEEMYTVFAEPLSNLNTLLKDWRTLGGREDVIEGFINVFNTLRGIINAIRAGFRELFPKTTALDLKKLTSAFSQLSKQLIISNDALEKIQKVAKVAFYPLKILATVAKSVVQVFAVLAMYIIHIAENFSFYVDKVKIAISQNEKLQTVLNKVSKGFSYIGKAIVSAIEAVEDFIKNFNGIDSIAKLAANVANAIKTFVPQFFASGRNLVSGLIQGIISGAPAFIQKAIELGKSFLNAFDRYMGIHSPATTMIERAKQMIAGLQVGFGEGMQGIADSAKTIAMWFINAFDKFLDSKFGKSVTDVFKNIWANINAFVPKISTVLRNFFATLDFGRVAVVGLVAAGLWSIKQISGIVEGIGEIIKGTGAILGGFGSILKNIGLEIRRFGDSVVSAINKRSRIDAFKSFAIGVGILSASILVLSRITKEDLNNALYAAGIVLTVSLVTGVIVGVLGKVLSKAPELQKHIISFALVILAFNASLLLMTQVVKTLIGIDFNSAVTSLEIMGIMMAGLLAVMAVLGLIGRYSKGVGKAIPAILAIALALKVFIKSIKDLVANPIENADWDLIIMQIELFIATFIALSAAVALAGKHPLRAGLTLIAFALSLKWFMEILRDVSEMNFKNLRNQSTFDNLLQNLAIMIGTLAAIAIVMRIAGGSALKLGLGILALAVSINVLIKAFQKLNAINFGTEDVARIYDAFKMLIKVFMLLLIVSMIPAKAAKVSMALSVAIIAISGSLALLTLLDPGRLQAAANALSLVMVVFGVMEMLSSVADGAKSILAISVAIAAIAGSLILLQLFDSDAVMNAASSFAICLVTLATAIAAASLISNMKSVGVIAALVVAIIAIAASLSYLGAQIQNGSQIEAAAWIIAGVMIALGVAAMAAQNSLKGAGVMAIMALEAALVAATLIGLVYFAQSSDDVLKAAGAIALVIAVLAGASALATIGLAGAGVMAIMVVEAAAVATILWGMTELIKDPDKMVQCALTLVATMAALVVVGTLAVLATAGILPLAALVAILGGLSIVLVVAAGAFTIFASGVWILAEAITAVTPILPQFGQSVGEMLKSISAALVESAKNMSLAGYEMAYGLGFNLVAGLINGLLGGIESIIETAVGLVDTFLGAFRGRAKIHSPSEETESDGKNLILGLIKGLFSGEVSLREAGSSIADIALSGITGKADNFFSAGQSMGGIFANGLSGVLNNALAKIGVDLGNVVYSAEKESELKHEVFLAEQERDAAYRRGDSAQNKAAWNQEVGRRKQALAEYQNQFNTSSNAISSFMNSFSDMTGDLTGGLDDLSSGLGDLSLGGGGGGGGSTIADEVEETIEVFRALDRAIGITAAKYKSFDKSLSDDKATNAARETVLGFAMALATSADGMDKSGEDVELTLSDLAKAFTDYTKSVKSSVESQMDAFKEFNKGDFLNADAIIKDLDSQINGVQSFIYMIDQLSKKEIDPQLLKSIIDMGPENGYAYAEAFYNATDDQLKSLNSKYELFSDLEENAGDALAMSLAEAFKDSDYRFGDLGAEAGQELLNTFAEALGDGDATEISKSMSELFEKALDGFDPSTLDRAIVELPPVVAVLDATVEQVTKDYKRLNDNLSDTDALNSATDAVLSFAISLAAASQETDAAGNKIELTLEDLEQSLKDYKKSLQDTVESQIDLFGEFEKGDILNSANIVKSFKSQISGIQEFMYMVDQLSKKELDPRLLQSIIEMGPESGYAYAEMFYSMGDTAIKEMNSTYGMWNDIRDAVSDGMLSVIAEAYAGTVYSFGDLGQEAGSELLKSLAETFKEANIDENDLSQGIVSVWEKIFEGFDPSTLGRKLLDKSDVYTIDKYTISIAKDYKKLSKTFDRDIAVSSASDAVLGFALSLQYTSEEAEYSGEAIEFTLEELESALADYEDSIQSTAKSQLSLFHEFEKGDILTFEEIMKSFDSQINGLNEFMNMIDALSKKGLDPQFIKDIVDMGPEAGYKYAEVFMDATDKQIQEANSGYRARSSALSTYGETMVSSVAKSFADSATPFGELGAQAGQIVIGGLKAELSTISEYGPELAAGMQKTIDTAKEIVESDPDDILTVTLVVDDEDAQESLRALGNSVGGHLGFNLGVTDALAQSFASKDEDDDDDGYYGDTTITNNNITQNFNYEGSKPLTPVEIYRHTHRAVK